MDDSILLVIKKLLGIEKNYTHFDIDIITYINSALSVLNQLGVGPSDGFRIYDEKTTWGDFLNNDKQLEDVKTYVYLKVKIMFDPPLNSAVLKSTENLIAEHEWRINVTAESTNH